jgi:hypothetical protein
LDINFFQVKNRCDRSYFHFWRGFYHKKIVFCCRQKKKGSEYGIGSLRSRRSNDHTPTHPFDSTRLYSILLHCLCDPMPRITPPPPNLSHPLSLSLSLSVNRALCLPVCLSLFLSPSLSLTPSLSLSYSLSLHALSLSHSLSISLSLRLCLPYSHSTLHLIFSMLVQDIVILVQTLTRPRGQFGG